MKLQNLDTPALFVDAKVLQFIGMALAPVS